ncbi:hypothetical protein BH24ACI3_BH24ACI3_11910 [soil metagenome]
MSNEFCYFKRRELCILFVIVITLCLQPSCSSEAVGETDADSAAIGPPPERIAEADGLFAERADLNKLREAVALLESLRNPSARYYEVEWKFSKYSLFLGRRLENESQKEGVFKKGRAAGLIASRMEPEKPDGHFWSGANLGELSKLSPVTVGIKSRDDIRETMNEVIEIQPDYHGASAYDALAQLELATRIYGGKAEKAVEYLEKGLAISPANSKIKTDLAEAYLGVRRKGDARKQIDEVLKMEPNPDYVLEHNEAVEKAKRLRKKYF